MNTVKILLVAVLVLVLLSMSVSADLEGGSRDGGVYEGRGREGSDRRDDREGSDRRDDREESDRRDDREGSDRRDDREGREESDKRKGREGSDRRDDREGREESDKRKGDEGREDYDRRNDRKDGGNGRYKHDDEDRRYKHDGDRKGHKGKYSDDEDRDRKDGKRGDRKEDRDRKDDKRGDRNKKGANDDEKDDRKDSRRDRSCRYHKGGNSRDCCSGCSRSQYDKKSYGNDRNRGRNNCCCRGRKDYRKDDYYRDDDYHGKKGGKDKNNKKDDKKGDYTVCDYCVGSKCFFLTAEYSSERNARKWCKKEGGHLADISGWEEFVYANWFLNHHKIDRTWAASWNADPFKGDHYDGDTCIVYWRGESDKEMNYYYTRGSKNGGAITAEPEGCNYAHNFGLCEFDRPDYCKPSKGSKSRPSV